MAPMTRARAAQNPETAGFDGVEIHSANGCLLGQFLRDGTNRRTDRYGGNAGNRARLLFEVVEAVAECRGGGRVGVRLSPRSDFNDIPDSDPDATFGYVAGQLNRFGLAYLHIVEGGAAMAGIRNAFTGPYMANGGYDYGRAVRSLAEGSADLISFGKLFLATPDLPVRFSRHAPLNEPEPENFYGGDRRGYTDYPTLAEAEARN